MKSAKCKVPRGFSLLEVILAIAILAGAMATLGEFARIGFDSSRIARDTTYALLLCESQIDRFASGLDVPSAGDGQSCEDATDTSGPAWLYSVEMSQTEVQGLISLTVTFYQDMPDNKQPAQCTLTRWIVDPGVEFTSPDDSSETGTTGTGTTGSTGATGS
jgi:type II secretion system protein I